MDMREEEQGAVPSSRVPGPGTPARAPCLGVRHTLGRCSRMAAYTLHVVGVRCPLHSSEHQLGMLALRAPGRDRPGLPWIVYEFTSSCSVVKSQWLLDTPSSWPSTLTQLLQLLGKHLQYLLNPLPVSTFLPCLGSYSPDHWCNFPDTRQPSHSPSESHQRSLFP